jgi:hypothetical protein
MSTVKIRDKIYPIVLTKKFVRKGQELFLNYSKDHIMTSDKYDYREENLKPDEIDDLRAAGRFIEEPYYIAPAPEMCVLPLHRKHGGRRRPSRRIRR